MKRSKYSDKQILAIGKEGTHGITEQTYYRWKAKYGGTELSEMQRQKQLEDENRRLKHIVAEQTLDIQALKAVWQKVVGPIAKREVVGWFSALGNSLQGCSKRPQSRPPSGPKKGGPQNPDGLTLPA